MLRKQLHSLMVAASRLSDGIAFCKPYRAFCIMNCGTQKTAIPITLSRRRGANVYHPFSSNLFIPSRPGATEIFIFANAKFILVLDSITVY